MRSRWLCTLTARHGTSGTGAETLRSELVPGKALLCLHRRRSGLDISSQRWLSVKIGQDYSGYYYTMLDIIWYRWVLHSIPEMISPSSLNEFALVDRNHCLQWEGIEYVTASFDWTIYQWILIRLNSEVFQCSTWANGQEHMRSWHESQDFKKTVTFFSQLERLKSANASDQALKLFLFGNSYSRF